MLKFTVGAYAASPSAQGWDPEKESIYLQGIRSLPNAEAIRGLELPFFGTLHRHDPDRFLRMLDPKWDFVLTLIPGVMERLQSNPKEGLASSDLESRQSAIEFVGLARNAVETLCQWAGRACVQGVEIHSAPQLGKPGVESTWQDLSTSLQEVASWNWCGAGLLVEHCDRYKKSQPPAKGFLPLEEEISAIRSLKAASTPVSVLINWGRSAIEDRSALSPELHLAKCLQNDLLGGLIFSGVAEGDPLYPDWADSHAPFNRTLLTEAKTHECLKLLEVAPPILGLKMQALPKDLTPLERAQFIGDNLSALQRAAAGAFVRRKA